ncbi:hypothetical protein R1flu_015862 [Riccia fluitans]|uniref:Uncharacterized protein n=1 Tax=Riccia fluitans TaxID=41844 RepID=A0ABD1YKM0_9MARC
MIRNFWAIAFHSPFLIFSFRNDHLKRDGVHRIVYTKDGAGWLSGKLKNILWISFEDRASLSWFRKTRSVIKPKYKIQVGRDNHELQKGIYLWWLESCS